MTEEQLVETPEELTNQTLFSNQEPLLQKSGRTPAKVDDFELAEPKKPKNKLIYIAGGTGAILLILILLLAVLKPKQSPTVVLPSPSVTPVIQGNKSQFQQRLDELQSDLDAADPSKLDLSVPPVDMELSLDPIKK